MNLPFTPEQLEAAVEEGLVTKRAHPSLPLFIFNYSPDVQYRNYWNDVTLNCRGLILDADYNIVARPWKKFFNLGQVNLPIQMTDPVEVMDKADGSLGILYPVVIDTPEVFDIQYGVATRGSFTSDQAYAATAMWQEKYDHLDPIPGYTMLFEIIYPENRIVLDYGDTKDLMLLGAVENENGYYIGPNEARYLWTARGYPDPVPSEWTGPVVDVMPYKSISEALGHTDRPNAEGYVIRSHNFMVKVKQVDYLALHKIVTNLSAKTVWEQMSRGRTVSDICKDIPDEFHSWVSEIAEPMLLEFDNLYDECYDEFNKITERVGLADRKKFAIEAQKSKHKAAMFTLLDGKPIKDYLWKSVRPKSTDGLPASNSVP